jgi:hypothetical protein
VEMTQAPAAIFKIATESPQPPRGKDSRARKAAAAQPMQANRAAGRVVGTETRAATRGDGEVIELDHGITVYPPRQAGGRWRAVWYENDERQQCESVSEEKLSAKLGKVREPLALDAANTRRPCADLIAFYLAPNQLPVEHRWSGSRRAHLPGHQDKPHAEDRQRRPDGRRRSPGCPNAVRHGQRGHRRRLPGQLSARQGERSIAAGAGGGSYVGGDAANCASRQGCVRVVCMACPAPTPSGAADFHLHPAQPGLTGLTLRPQRLLCAAFDVCAAWPSSGLFSNLIPCGASAWLPRCLWPPTDEAGK